MHNVEHELRSLSYACDLVAGALGLRGPHPRRHEYFSGLQCDTQDHPSHPSASNSHEVKHCAAQQGPWLHDACVQGTAALCLLPRSPRKASSSRASGRPGRRTCCCSPWTSSRAGERRARVSSANGSLNMSLQCQVGQSLVRTSLQRHKGQAGCCSGKGAWPLCLRVHPHSHCVCSTAFSH